MKKIKNKKNIKHKFIGSAKELKSQKCKKTIIKLKEKKTNLMLEYSFKLIFIKIFIKNFTILLKNINYAS